MQALDADSLAPLVRAVNLEGVEAVPDDRISIFAPSNAAFEEVSSVLSTIDSSTLTQVCCLLLRPFMFTRRIRYRTRCTGC